MKRRRTTWHPPAIPPAKSSHPNLMRPVSGSIALPRIRSLTVNLIAFSGATPCAMISNAMQKVMDRSAIPPVEAQDPDRIPRNPHCERFSEHSRDCSCIAAVRRLYSVDFACYMFLYEIADHTKKRMVVPRLAGISLIHHVSCNIDELSIP